VGWHVPSAGEFEDLIEYLGGDEIAIQKLKSSTLWKVNGNNLSAFNAKPIGGRAGDGNFGGDGEETAFWTDTFGGERNKYNNRLRPGACCLFIKSNQLEKSRSLIFNYGASIRCVKN
jgi:uncharacterized protein (TIGR02145 family)